MKTPDQIVKKAIKDPQKIYASPKDVLNDERLSAEEKDKILKSWEEDQVALMRAEGENMPQLNEDMRPDPALLLEKIKKAEQTLEGKTGGKVTG